MMLRTWKPGIYAVVNDGSLLASIIKALNARIDFCRVPMPLPVGESAAVNAQDEGAAEAMTAF
ncbi:MAG: hypothetical protein AAF940_08170 [Pseudomonadota bacterium]